MDLYNPVATKQQFSLSQIAPVKVNASISVGLFLHLRYSCSTIHTFRAYVQ